MSTRQTASGTGLRRIGFSLGELDSLHHGLGEFATQLLQRIGRQADVWRQQHGVVFDIHAAPQHAGFAGPGFNYIAADKSHRQQAAAPGSYAIWHTLHQLSRLLPPAQTRCRLVTVHDLIFLDGGSFVSRFRHRQRTRALLGRTDGMVAISDWTGQELRRRLAWAGPLTTIHNGATDLTTHAQQPLADIGALGGRPFLLHLSRLAPSKNPQAILALAARWPAMDFVLCGPRSQQSRAIEDSNRLANVHVRLDVADAQKAWAFAHCAGFVFPSLAEGFGLPPIEAMHFGKPVFLAARTSLPEVGGDAAWYFDSFDPDAMRAVIETGLREAADPERCARIRARARHFDWDVCCAAYLALYERQLAQA